MEGQELAKKHEIVQQLADLLQEPGCDGSAFTSIVSPFLEELDNFFVSHTEYPPSLPWNGKRFSASLDQTAHRDLLQWCTNELKEIFSSILERSK